MQENNKKRESRDVLEERLKKYLNKKGKHCYFLSEKRKQELEEERKERLRKSNEGINAYNVAAVMLLVEKIFCDKKLSKTSDLLKELQKAKIKNIVFNVRLEKRSTIRIYDPVEFKRFKELSKEYREPYKILNKTPEYFEIESSRAFLIANNLF